MSELGFYLQACAGAMCAGTALVHLDRPDE